MGRGGHGGFGGGGGFGHGGFGGGWGHGGFGGGWGHGGWGGGWGWGGPWGPWGGGGLLVAEAALLGAGAFYMCGRSNNCGDRGYDGEAVNVALPPAQVIVNLHCASGLRDAGWLAKQDVVVFFFLYDNGRLVSTGKSPVVRGGGSAPIWKMPPGCALSFAVRPDARIETMSLVAQIKSRNSVMQDTVVGTATVAAPVASVADGVVRDVAVEPLGVLTVTLSHVPSPAAPPSYTMPTTQTAVPAAPTAIPAQAYPASQTPTTAYVADTTTASAPPPPYHAMSPPSAPPLVKATKVNPGEY